MDLSTQQIAALKWAMRANDERACGLYGPSLRRGLPPDDDCEGLVSLGLLYRSDKGRGSERGYWLTQEGRAALTK